MGMTRAALCAAAAAAALLPGRARAQASKIRVAGTYSDPFGEAFFVKESGAFARVGYDVEASHMPNAGAVAAAIGGGSLDMGIGDLISGVNAIVNGVPIMLVAGSGLYRSGDGSIMLAAAKDGPIRQPRDLAGKTIGVPTLVGLTTACLRS
jgi:ABC-type nitrate/sulfonate/bicarbonate transport system substrate-binding protein